MSKKRKHYSPAFKAKAALAAIKGNQTTSELAARYQIHPTMVNTWKRELLDGAPELLDSKGGKTGKSHQDEVDNLYRQIGLLTVERDFLARSSITDERPAPFHGRAFSPGSVHRRTVSITRHLAFIGVLPVPQGLVRES